MVKMAKTKSVIPNTKMLAMYLTDVNFEEQPDGKLRIDVPVITLSENSRASIAELCNTLEHNDGINSRDFEKGFNEMLGKMQNKMIAKYLAKRLR